MNMHPITIRIANNRMSYITVFLRAHITILPHQKSKKSDYIVAHIVTYMIHFFSAV